MLLKSSLDSDTCNMDSDSAFMATAFDKVPGCLLPLVKYDADYTLHRAASGGSLDVFVE